MCLDVISRLELGKGGWGAVLCKGGYSRLAWRTRGMQRRGQESCRLILYRRAFVLRSLVIGNDFISGTRQQRDRERVRGQ